MTMEEGLILGISLRTRKMLWGRSASRCNFPTCRCELVMDATETDDESIVGEECHIVSKARNGPRGEVDLRDDLKDRYANLILMCRMHHAVVDDQCNTYTVECLRKMKSDHEQWVKSTLDFDAQKQHDDEIYSSYVEKWCSLADINDWKNWGSCVLEGAPPFIPMSVDRKLRELEHWLFSRVWPRRYPELEAGFENFRWVLSDFRITFHKHCKEWDGRLAVDKIYKLDTWNEELHRRRLREYEFHCDLLQDLMLELTRAANHVCDEVREFIDPSFRMVEGALVLRYGPCMDLSSWVTRPEYTAAERASTPYHGLEDFKRLRKYRDRHFGVGMSAEDPEFLQLIRGESDRMHK